MSKKVAVLPGDGIGPEVVSSTVAAITSLGTDIELITADIGYECFKRTGEALPRATAELVNECDAVLLGCVTIPENERNFRNPVIEIKKRLDLYANVRPINKIVPDIGKIDINAVFIRENTEGLFDISEVEDVEGISYTKRLSYAGCRRICKFARNYAESHGRKRITCVHKADIYRKTDGLFLDTFREVMDGSNVGYDDAKTEDMVSSIILEPQNIDVVVTQSLYGDILSEEAASLCNGVHLSPSSGIGDNKALFEPMHKSNPELEGLNTVNPTASILSGSLMLQYLGYKEEGMLLKEAVASAYKRGYRTVDIGGTTGTFEFTSQIVKYCEKPL